ncbi:unnamed protein product [Schistosoma curassoni]|uniref:Uncharacterized protein n=1 Tax=Schistosoma curassoni TaxID=6186 RepID=A0A183JVA9_9TREM|nr:unnamed protein product [Schistosoma curassoni]
MLTSSVCLHIKAMPERVVKTPTTFVPIDEHHKPLEQNLENKITIALPKQFRILCE